MGEFERRMNGLRARFAERARGDGEALQRAWADRDLDALQRISHSLAGNAALFGHPELGAAACSLEAALEDSCPDQQLEAKVIAVVALIPGVLGG